MVCDTAAVVTLEITRQALSGPSSDMLNQTLLYEAQSSHQEHMLQTLTLDSENDGAQCPEHKRKREIEFLTS